MTPLSHRHNLLILGLAALTVFALATTLRPQTSVAHAVELAPNKDGKVIKTESEWRELLTPEQFHVLREEGTEFAGTGALLNEHRRGTFKCSGCGNKLFASTTKFESGTGWPSFYQPLKGAVEEHQDRDGSGRVEVECARCNGHLGHVFDDGPKPTGLRYCMNSLALAFSPGK